MVAWNHRPENLMWPRKAGNMAIPAVRGLLVEAKCQEVGSSRKVWNCTFVSETYREGEPLKSKNPPKYQEKRKSQQKVAEQWNATQS